MKSYLALTKPRLTLLSVLSAVAGYVLGFQGIWDWNRFLLTLLGVISVGGGANAFNMLMEREFDALMSRTRKRPLPSQQLNPTQVLAFALIFSMTGLYILSALVNPLAGWLGLITLVTYVLVYTPLKRITSFCTLAGAVPGALPPLIGYSAACGYLGTGVYFLAMIIFIWQMPHFLAISWLYRKDYAQAGFPMLSVLDDDRGLITGRQIVVYTMALFPISLAPTVLGFTGSLYFGGTFVLGFVFLLLSLTVIRGCAESKVRMLFRYSIIYLPLVMTLLLVDHRLFS